MAMNHLMHPFQYVKVMMKSIDEDEITFFIYPFQFLKIIMKNPETTRVIINVCAKIGAEDSAAVGRVGNAVCADVRTIGAAVASFRLQRRRHDAASEIRDLDDILYFLQNFSAVVLGCIKTIFQIIDNFKRLRSSTRSASMFTA